MEEVDAFTHSLPTVPLWGAPPHILARHRAINSLELEEYVDWLVKTTPRHFVQGVDPFREGRGLPPPSGPPPVAVVSAYDLRTRARPSSKRSASERDKA